MSSPSPRYSRGVKICVFCSSSDAVAPIYRAAADRLGRLLAEGGHELVYGGGGFGLMGAVAASARKAGARVTGVIPRFISERTGSDVDELIVTDGLRERKARMEQLADGFIALPGGFGTLEEVLEIVTLGQLGVVTKPVVFINTRGFYNPLNRMFELLYRQRFAKPEFRRLYGFVPTPEAAMAYLCAWSPAEKVTKWF